MCNRQKKQTPSREHQCLGRANCTLLEALELAVKHQTKNSCTRILAAANQTPGTAGLPLTVKLPDCDV